MYLVTDVVLFCKLLVKQEKLKNIRETVCLWASHKGPSWEGERQLRERLLLNSLWSNCQINFDVSYFI